MSLFNRHLLLMRIIFPIQRNIILIVKHYLLLTTLLTENLDIRPNVYEIDSFKLNLFSRFNSQKLIHESDSSSSPRQFSSLIPIHPGESVDSKLDRNNYQWMMASFSVSYKLVYYKLRVFVLYNKYIEGLLICRLFWLIITTFKIKVDNADTG